MNSLERTLIEALKKEFIIDERICLGEGFGLIRIFASAALINDKFKDFLLSEYRNIDELSNLFSKKPIIENDFIGGIFAERPLKNEIAERDFVHEWENNGFNSACARANINIIFQNHLRLVLTVACEYLLAYNIDYKSNKMTQRHFDHVKPLRYLFHARP